MAKTSLIVTSTTATDGKKLQKTLTDINSAATNEQLKSFGQRLNGLTTNTYVETNRVDRVNCDTEDGGLSGGKAFRNITITGVAQGATATISANAAEGASINPAVFFFANNTVTILTTTAAASDDTTIAKRSVTIPNNSGELYIGLIANDDFYADFIFAGVE